MIFKPYSANPTFYALDIVASFSTEGDWGLNYNNFPILGLRGLEWITKFGFLVPGRREGVGLQRLDCAKLSKYLCSFIYDFGK